jgi:mRNA-binding protein PUF3
VYLAAACSGLTRTMSNRGGIALSNSDAERPAHPSHASPWGNSIWNTTNTTPLGGFGFGSTRRDSSRPRGTHVAQGPSRNNLADTDTRAENGNYDLTDGKTGSGSLVADSETEWRPTRPSWVDAGTSSNPHVRSSGASPARKRSIVHTQPSQPFADASASSFFPNPRTSIVGAGPLVNPPKPLLDPTTSNFTSSLQNDFHNLSFNQPDVSQARPSTGVTSWPDTASVHSPNDDRRSVGASEYFASSSGAPSRNGSLPPSRHGAEPAQYAQQFDAFSRMSQAAPRQSTSFSYANGRPLQERSGSIQSESFHTLNRMALEQDQDVRLPHRQSFSTNGLASNYTHSGPDSHIARDSYLDAQLPARALDQPSQRNGTYTPDSFASGQVSDPNVQFQSFQFNTQSAPNGSGVRQSPFYSQTHTPPVYDRLNPYSSEQTLSHPNNFALVQNKLAGYQSQQERRNYVPHNQFQQQQYQHILPSAQLRHPYPYQFSAHNVMPISSLPPHMAMVTMPPMLPVQQPPRGPREQQTTDGTAVLGLKLAEFRRESKTSKRWELTDIYDDVVEFAGDQHGSRFIQQKLETANSEVKEKIFKELESNSLQLMQDVFGNYVIQKFFEHGDQTQKKILAGKMKGHVSALANQMYACRVVQKVLYPYQTTSTQTNDRRHWSTFLSTNKRPWSRNSRKMS